MHAIPQYSHRHCDSDRYSNLQRFVHNVQLAYSFVLGENLKAEQEDERVTPIKTSIQRNLTSLIPPAISLAYHIRYIALRLSYDTE